MLMTCQFLEHGNVFVVVVVLEENMSFLKKRCNANMLGGLGSSVLLASPPNCGYTEVNRYQAGLRELTGHTHHLFKISFWPLGDRKNFRKATWHLALQWWQHLSRLPTIFRNFSFLHYLDLLWNSLCSSSAQLGHHVCRSSC